MPPVARPRPPLTDAQRDLAGANYPLALHVARRLARPGRLEEYRDAAVDGLLMAARAYDPGRGAGFATLAGLYMARSISDKEKYLRRSCRRPDPPRRDAAPEPWVPPRIPDDDVDFEALVAALPPRDRLLLRLRYRDGLARRVIAARLGTTRAWATELDARALGRLRDTLSREGS